MPLPRFEARIERSVPGEGRLTSRQLTSGLVNDTYEVARAGRHYAVRVASARSAEFGLDRPWECRVVAIAAAAGVGPAVRSCDPLDGLLVTDWLPGRRWSADEIRETANIEAMTGLLRKVHAIRIPDPARRVAPITWLDGYLNAFDARHGVVGFPEGAGHWSALRTPARELASVLAGDGLHVPALCHGDLHRDNVIVGDELRLVDWEYAHVSDAYWDLAGWVSNNDADDEFAAKWLEMYLARPARPREWQHLQQSLWLFDYICLLWNDLFVSASDRASRIRSEALAERLEKRLNPLHR
ncbi:MAG: phosphotransferase [Pseudomonadota bacterium]|nr:phosphotransferase [Pseudomonadota bacterium]